MLITLIYGSATNYQMHQDELAEILETARRNNAKVGITGMLLYKNMNFIQVLEGEAEAVEQLYEKIKLDERHHSVYTILKREIKAREFGEWKMSFVDLDETPPVDLPGYSDFLQQSLSDQMDTEQASRVYVFLKLFRDSMR